MFTLSVRTTITITNNLNQEVSLEKKSELYPQISQIERCLKGMLYVSEAEIQELCNELLKLYVERTKYLRNLLGEDFENKWVDENE